jgi:SAM-dependent methyltransferase
MFRLVKVLARPYQKLTRNSRLIFGVFLPALDWLRTIHSPGLRSLRKRLVAHMREQSANWPNAYTTGYFYQGFWEVGITGAKPTEFRFAQYEVDSLLAPGFSALDIGSNCGFVALHLAKSLRRVVGVEINPYLIKVGKETARYLARDNVEFICESFDTFETTERFDIVLSLSNHHTIDGNLDLGFERYVRKIHGFVKPGGYLFFESHNVWGPSQGGPGDDGDMDEKFAILNRYFEIDRWRMVKCYLPHFDVDKLFIIGRNVASPSPATTFKLDEARTKYSY